MTESVGSPPTGTPALPRETVPWVDPQAQVTDVVVIGGGPGGEVPPAAEASERGPVVHVVDVSTGEVPGSSVLSEGMDGTTRLVIDHQCSVLVGVTISGGGVKEMLHAATLTVGARVSLTELWHAVPAFPTVALPDRGRGVAARLGSSRVLIPALPLCTDIPGGPPCLTSPSPTC